MEQIQEHLGDKVLLDGIPAVLLLPTDSCEELMETVSRRKGRERLSARLSFIQPVISVRLI